MLIVLVSIHVKPDRLEEFKSATLDNARNSVQEQGIVRFDAIQQEDDPSRFVLVEAYRTPEDQLRHRETAHYTRWRDTVADMMVEPRAGVKYTNLYPDDHGWR